MTRDEPLLPGRRRSLTLFIVGGCAALLLLVVVAAVISSSITNAKIRQTQLGTTEQIDSSTKVLKLIRGCVQPQGTCAKRSAAQLADAVADLNHVSVLAAACAVQNQGNLAATTRCVTRALTVEQPPRPNQRHHR